MTSGAKAIVAYNGKILLVQRDDKPNIPYPNMWDLPGGGFEEDKDKDLEDTIKREIKEEFGIEPARVVNLGNEVYGERQAGRFLVLIEDADFEKIKLGDEGQKHDFFTIDAALSMEVVPNLKDFIFRNQEVLKTAVEGNLTLSPEQISLSSHKETK